MSHIKKLYLISFSYAHYEYEPPYPDPDGFDCGNEFLHHTIQHEQTVNSLKEALAVVRSLKLIRTYNCECPFSNFNIKPVWVFQKELQQKHGYVHGYYPCFNSKEFLYEFNN